MTWSWATAAITFVVTVLGTLATVRYTALKYALLAKASSRATVRYVVHKRSHTSLPITVDIINDGPGHARKVKLKYATDVVQGSPAPLKVPVHDVIPPGGSSPVTLEPTERSLKGGFGFRPTGARVEWVDGDGLKSQPVVLGDW